MREPGRSTVLITGAAGMLGRELEKVFCGVHRLVCSDIPEMDIRDRAGTVRSIEILAPRLIIHAAAYTAVDKAEEEPGVALAVNGEGTAAVAEGAARVGARLIYISTDYVFDGLKTAPYTEEDRPRPMSAYGISKLSGELAAAVLEDHLIVRTAWLFGPAKENFVSGMAARARRREAVRVVNDQRGCPTYAPHLAGGIQHCHRP